MSAHRDRDLPQISTAHTASIANRVPTFITSPQGRDGRAAILTGDNDGRVWILSLYLQSSNVNGSRGVVNCHGLRLLLLLTRGTATAAAAATLPLNNIQVSRFRHAVVVGRTTAATLCAASAIALSTAWAGP